MKIWGGEIFEERGEDRLCEIFEESKGRLLWIPTGRIDSDVATMEMRAIIQSMHV